MAVSEDRSPIHVFFVGRAGFRADALTEALNAAPTLELVGTRCDPESPLEDIPSDVDVLVVDATDGPDVDAGLLDRMGKAPPKMSVVVLGSGEHPNGGHAAGTANDDARTGRLRLVHSDHSLETVKETIIRAGRDVRGASGQSAGVSASRLTPREQDVLRGVAGGLTNREIAASLDLSVSTVKNHLHSIYTKLDVHSRVKLVRRALELRLLSKRHLME